MSSSSSSTPAFQPALTRLLGGSPAQGLLAEEELVNAIASRDKQARSQALADDNDDEASREDLAPQTIKPRDRLERLELIQRVEALEYSSDVFGSSVAVRSDTIGLFKTMVSSLVVILAFKHTSKLTKANQIGLFVASVLVFLVYVISQLTYHISHWLKWTNLQKRNISRAYDNEGFERSAKEEQRDSVATLWSLRVAEGELLAYFTRDIVLIVNTYITFILVAVLLDQINANFADGQFIFEKLVELIIIVLVVFAFFASISYRRDSLVKAYRL